MTYLESNHLETYKTAVFLQIKAWWINEAIKRAVNIFKYSKFVMVKSWDKHIYLVLWFYLVIAFIINQIFILIL